MISAILLNAEGANRIVPCSSVPMAAFFTPVSVASLLLPYTLGFMLVGAAFGAVGGVISIGRYLRKGGSELVGL